MAEIVRRRSWGGVLPLGRHASISGSSLIQYASDSIAHSSFQEEQNARHHNRFKFEQALVCEPARGSNTEGRHPPSKLMTRVRFPSHAPALFHHRLPPKGPALASG